MINRKVVVVFTVACACVSMFLACQNSASTQKKVKDPIVQVGQAALGKSALEAFEKTVRAYPVPLAQFYPGPHRQPITFMAEVEAIYQHIKAKGISVSIDSLDWVWKKRYFTSLPFFELLSVNLGFTDDELQKYYKRATEEFRVTVQTDDGLDSSFIPPFENIKRLVADALFYEKFQPDSAFITKLGEQGQDSASLRNHWLYNVRTNPADFFMRQFFLERTGEEYADSVQQIYGEGKTITPEDLEIIRSWVPENHRNMRTKDLVEWLYKWKIFAEHVEKKKIPAEPSYADMIYWASRIEHIYAYLNSEVVPGLQVEASESDTPLAELIIFDQVRNAARPPLQRVQAEVDNILRMRFNAMFDNVIYNIRKDIGITFLQDELRDEKDADPIALMAKADSLKDTAADMPLSDAEPLFEEAEALFRTLSTDFAFTAEGRRAMGELAKMYMDRYSASSGFLHERLLTTAINFYRRTQMLDTDPENLCNSHFMIGFTYDEHMKNYALAEANYKWILKNTPDCALAADAEFMILHLGEPMPGIEEIQGRSLRQGRAVDFDDGGDLLAAAE